MKLINENLKLNKETEHEIDLRRLEHDNITQIVKKRKNTTL